MRLIKISTLAQACACALTNLQFMQALPVFTFANQAGLDMLETTFVALQDITLEKIFDDHGRKSLCSEFPQIMQQVSHFLSLQFAVDNEIHCQFF